MSDQKIRRSDDEIMKAVPVILSRANDWLAFVQEPTAASEDDLLQLEAILDKLNVLRHELGPLEALHLEGEETVAPRSNQAELRKCLSTRFPMLGFYNIPEMVSVDLMQTGLMLGDAIDDLLDITNELTEVVWRIGEGRPINACWTYGLGYDSHWRFHARSLLWYLEMRRMEQP